MVEESNGTHPTIQFPAAYLFGALEHEINLLGSARSSTTLFSGTRINATPLVTYYQFEIPEGLELGGVTEVLCAFGSGTDTSCTATIVGHDCQYLTLAFALDLGPFIPESLVSWIPSAKANSTLEMLRRRGITGNIPLAPRKGSAAIGAPVSGDTGKADPLSTVRKNPVSFVWGPNTSGKSTLARRITASYLAEGKRVLYVNPFSARIDEWIDGVMAGGGAEKALSPDSIVRVGYPNAQRLHLAPVSAPTLAAKVLEPLQGSALLLATCLSGAIREAMSEEHTQKLAELRQRVEDKNRQIAQIDNDLKGLQLQIDAMQNASMLERVKKGYSKESLADALKKLQEKQTIQKRLQNLQSSLSTEILKQELKAPLNDRELRAYREAQIEVTHKGGTDVMRKTIEDARTAAVKSFLIERPCVAAGLTETLQFGASTDVTFDVVIVDDAHAVNLTEIAALTGLAQERIVLIGDPLRIGPSSLANSELAMNWLQQEIFEYASGAHTLYEFFEWSKRFKGDVVFCSSQISVNSKLAKFGASVIFNDSYQVAETGESRGNIYIVDTTELKSQSKQYIGRKRILPYNDLHSRKTAEMVKHALMEPGRIASDIGVIVPFSGPTMHIKRELRLNGIDQVDVGLPEDFVGLRKKAIIFDTTVAGINYTMKSLDDKKVGAHGILRMVQTIFSAVDEDLYIIADFDHIRNVYKGRLFVDLLSALQQIGGMPPMSANVAKKFDDLSGADRASLFSVLGDRTASQATARQAPQKVAVDHETELRMRLAAKQADAAKSPSGPRNFEHDTFLAVERVLGKLTDVNLVSLFVGGALVFRRSPNAEDAVSKLPARVAQSEKDFREIMEAWNTVIYEMSGGNKTDLSFFAKQTPETRVRWDINSLKIYYSSDVEAVIEEGKHQVAVAVSKIFQECLGKSQPANPGEWSLAYLNFLSKMELYLDWISDRVRE